MRFLDQSPATGAYHRDVARQIGAGLLTVRMPLVPLLPGEPVGVEGLLQRSGCSIAPADDTSIRKPA